MNKSLYFTKAVIVSMFTTLFLAGCGTSDNASSNSQDTSRSSAQDASSGDGLELSSKIISESGAPYTITQCKGNVTSSADASGNKVPHLNIQVAFTNNSQQPFSATKVLIRDFDSFGKTGDAASYHVAEEYTVKADVAPGASVTSEPAQFDSVPPDTGKISCQPDGVAYANGETWDSPQVTLLRGQ